MGALDKLNMICPLYKKSFIRRWYIYICFHSFIITVANAWILHCLNVQLLDPSQKIMPLQVFQGMLADHYQFIPPQ